MRGENGFALKLPAFTSARIPKQMHPRTVSAFWNFAILAAGAFAASMAFPAAAQKVSPSTAPALPSATPAPAAGLIVPGFWDPRRRPERPDTSRVTLIRFLTENDYPPFNYAGPDGNPAGFNVDLAH